MKLYTNDLDNAITENYTPQVNDILNSHKIVETEFKEGKMPPKISELPISSATLVDYYPNEDTARRFNQSWLGISTKKSDDESAHISNYRFFGKATCSSFMQDLGANSIDDLVGKELIRVERKDGTILGYSPKHE